MKLLQSGKLLVTNPEIRDRYIKWKLGKLFTGRAPYIEIPRGQRLYPADRFNDYIAIAVQHPSQAEWRLLDDLLSEHAGGMFVDVGANVGAMSLLAHSTGRVSSILAFEPSHRYCEAWHRNVIANSAQNATLFQAAIGHYDGNVEFRVDPRMPLNGKIHQGQVHFSTLTETVKLVRLDSILDPQDLPHIALLKIDVEGAEPLVIKGATQLLKSGRVRAILLEFIVEFMEDMGENPYEFVGTIKELGFKLYQIEIDGSHTEIADTDVQAVVDSRRVAPDAPLRPFEQINLVAKRVH